jgi:hypothetical protein
VTSRGKKLIAEAAGVFGTLVAWGLGVAWGVDARFSPQRVPSGLFCFFIGTEGRWPPGGGGHRERTTAKTRVYTKTRNKTR